jgi:hypothetical protein
MDVVQIGWGGLDWIYLAQDRYRWRALVKVLLNSGVHKMLVYYRVATLLDASRIALSSTEFVIIIREGTASPESLFPCLDSCSRTQ